LGAAVTGLIYLFGKPAVIVVLFLAFGLAVRGVAGEFAKERGWWAVTAVSAVLTALTWQWYHNLSGAVVLGAAVTLGCITHCVGDAITKQGVPFFAPLIPRASKRWWEITLPDAIAIKAGGQFEKLFLGPALTIAVGVLLIFNVDGAPQAIYDAFAPNGLGE
jgi:hypothetical protein